MGLKLSRLPTQLLAHLASRRRAGSRTATHCDRVFGETPIGPRCGSSAGRLQPPQLRSGQLQDWGPFLGAMILPQVWIQSEHFHAQQNKTDTCSYHNINTQGPGGKWDYEDEFSLNCWKKIKSSFYICSVKRVCIWGACLLSVVPSLQSRSLCHLQQWPLSAK